MTLSPDTGPTLTHAEVPRAVERLAERVARLEATVRESRTERADVRYDEAAAKRACDEVKTWPESAQKAAKTVLSDLLERGVPRLQALVEAWDWARHLVDHTTPPAADAAAVPNPLPEATTGSGNGTGMRTERVTLEFKCRGDAISRSRIPFDGILAGDGWLRDGESVRVVPTAGTGLTEEDRVAMQSCVMVIDQHGRTNIGVAIDEILARDAAARDGGDEVARLTAERDAAIRERDKIRSDMAFNCDLSSLAASETERLRARVRELEAAGEPVAWGIMRVGGGWMAILENAVQAETSRTYWDESENWVHAVVPLYAAPPQERVVRLPNWVGLPSAAYVEIRERLTAAGVRWEVGE